MPNFVVDCMHNAVIGNEDSNSIGKECSTERNCLIECSTEGIHSDEIPERSAAVFCKNLEFGSSNSMVAGSSNTIPQCPASVRQSRGTESTRLGNFKNVNENDRMLSSKITSNEFESCGEKDVLSEKHKTVLNSALKTFVNVKVEPLDNNEADKNALDNSCLVNIVPIKSELDFIDAYSVDVIDHMLLRDRMKLLTSRGIQNTNIYAEGSRKIMPSALDFKPILSESATPLRIKRTRKRKKTAT